MFKFKSVFLSLCVTILSLTAITANAVMTDSGRDVIFPGNPGGITLGVGVGTGTPLTTVFTSDNSFAGNTFDILVIGSNPVTLNGFDVNLEATGTTETITLYTRIGTSVGHENTVADWTLAGVDSAVASMGTDNPSHVNIGNIVLQPGVTYGFYIDYTSFDQNTRIALNYTNGGPSVFADANLQITSNTGQGAPAFSGSFFPRIVNTTFYYDIGSALPTMNIPTIGTYMLVLLALLLFATAFVVIRKNRRLN